MQISTAPLSVFYLKTIKKTPILFLIVLKLFFSFVFDLKQAKEQNTFKNRYIKKIRKMELKQEINQIVNSLPIDILGEVLSLNLKTILTEDRELLERLAK